MNNEPTPVGPKNVLLISGPLLHYRVSVYNYFLDRFDAHGWKLHVLTNSAPPRSQRTVRFPLQQLPFRLRHYIREIRRIRPAVVILFIHLKEPILWLLIHWLRLWSVPVVFWTKGANLDAAESRWRYHAFNYIFDHSDALILYSQNQLCHLKPRNQPKAVAANNTINFAEIPEVMSSREEIKREFNLPFKKYALFVGTMGIGGERKRIEHLVDLFAQIDEPGLGCVIVGKGMPENVAARLNSANTRYLGEVYDPDDLQVSKLFKAADIFVVPGHIGLGLNQAFFWGLPVVTEAGNQPPEIHCLRSGRNGFLVPENDVDTLREKVLLLLKDDDLRTEFSRHAREDIMRDASIENMFQGFLTAVKRAARGYRCRLPQHHVLT